MMEKTERETKKKKLSKKRVKMTPMVLDSRLYLRSQSQMQLKSQRRTVAQLNLSKRTRMWKD